MSIIIDLTHPIEPKMPVYPGDEQPAIATTASIGQDGYQARRLTLTTHTGTHLDAPAHLLPGGRTLDQFPVDYFQGRARVVDCRQAEGEITLAHLEPLAPLREADFILLLTGWDRHWGTEAYFTGFPVLSAEATEWLSRLPIKGLGLDAISIDRAGSAELPNHRLFLGQDKVIIENLTRLDAISGQHCQLYCLPLLITAADGAPARVMAVVPSGAGMAG